MNTPTCGLAALSRPRFLDAALVVCLAVAAFAPALRNGFTYDDELVVSDNPGLSGLLSPGAYFTRDYFALSGETTWRPLATLSYALDYRAWGANPFGYHLTNLLWHAAASVLFLALCLSLGAERRVAAAAACLYAVHPIQSEAVCAIGFREDLQCSAFYFAALALWPTLRSAGGELRRHVRAAASVICFILAMLSKEMAFSFPLMVLLKEALQGRSRLPGVTQTDDAQSVSFSASRDVTKRLESRSAGVTSLWLAVVVLLTGFFLGLPRFFSAPSAPPNPYTGVPLFVRLAAFPAIAVRYLRLLAVPWPLSVERIVVMEGAAFWVSSALSAIALLAVGALAWAAARRFAAGLQAFIAFLVLLAPVSNIVPIYNPMAERYLVLPCAAFCWAAAQGGGLVGGQWTGWTRWTGWTKWALVVALLGGAVALDWRRAADWRSPEALWGGVVAAESRSPRALLNYGLAMTEAGKPETALPALLRARDLSPGDVRVLNTLGWTLNNLQRYAEAKDALDRALRQAPDFGPAHLNMTVTCVGLGDLNGARFHARRAAALMPQSAAARGNLARLDAMEGGVNRGS